MLENKYIYPTLLHLALKGPSSLLELEEVQQEVQKQRTADHLKEQKVIQLGVVEEEVAGEEVVIQNYLMMIKKEVEEEAEVGGDC